MPTKLGMWKLFLVCGRDPGVGSRYSVLDGAAGGDPQHRDLYGARPHSSFHRCAVHDSVGATKSCGSMRLPRSPAYGTSLLSFQKTVRAGMMGKIP